MVPVRSEGVSANEEVHPRHLAGPGSGFYKGRRWPNGNCVARRSGAVTNARRRR